MELILSLIFVALFIGLNNVRIALLGDDKGYSEIFMSISVIIYGFVFSLFV